MTEQTHGYYLGLAKWVDSSTAARLKGITTRTLRKRKDRGTYVEGVHYRYVSGVGYEWCLKALDGEE